MRIGIILVAALLSCVTTASVGGQKVADRFPETDWEQVDPVAAGWSADKLKEAQTWSHQIGSTAVIVVHHGGVVAQWGDAAAKTPLASVRKSLLSALYGDAVERGDINLKQTLAELGIDDNEPSLSAEEKRATVRDLLECRSGVYHPALHEAPDMAAKRPARYSHKPRTFWYYNNWDVNTLGAIYEHAVRHSTFDALASEIAQPIGMQDYLASDGRYVTGAGSVYPAYPIDMSARDLARFALLYLRKGRWRERQVVPADWVEDSARAYSQADFAAGYGYFWWIGSLNDPTGGGVTLPEGSFFALGFGGQFAFVIPAYELVIVHRAAGFQYGGPGFGDMNHLLALIFDAGHLR